MMVFATCAGGWGNAAHEHFMREEQFAVRGRLRLFMGILSVALVAENLE